MENTPATSLSRVERLQKDIEYKKMRLRWAKGDKDNAERRLAAANEGSFIPGFRPRTVELSTRQKLQIALEDMSGVVAAIESAEEPKEEVRKNLEILIQRDDEWAQTEGEYDDRLLLFNMFGSLNSGKILTGPEVLAVLREHRTDESFLTAVVSSLENIKDKVRSFNAYNDKEMGYIQSSAKMAEPHVTTLKAELPADIEKAERQIERRSRHIMRLSEILGEELKKESSEESIFASGSDD